MDKQRLQKIEKKAQDAYQRALQKSDGIRQLRYILKDALLLLRKTYHALEQQPQDGWKRWVYDHFYAFEGHALHTIEEMQSLRGRGIPLYRITFLLYEVFSDGQEPLGQEAVEQALRTANATAELEECQLSFVYTALKGILILIAADACRDDCSEERREPLLTYAAAGLDAVYEIDFDKVSRHCSPVESILEQDPSCVYLRMERESRAHYRQVVARIAQRSGIAESQVARDVLHCAQQADAERERHVGFYLLNRDPQEIHAHRMGGILLAAVWLIPLALCVLLGVYSLPAALAAYLPLVETVRLLLTAAALYRTRPAHLPRIRLDNHAPKTVVTVSMVLPDASESETLLAQFERLSFSNRADNLFFCLLADLREEKRPWHPQDEANIAAAKKVFVHLNSRYGGRFVLFIRRRTYNKTQDAYSGWERKRGAIIEFVRFLQGGQVEPVCFVGNREQLTEMKYLITLDADTGLSFDAANRLISVAEHPLNRPVIDKRQIVTQGFGILVPRIGVDLESAKATVFTRIMAGAGGIATYEQACSDFYQDLFGSAIFSGKGLIDIQTFHEVVGRRFPEGAVLSHDILEGAYLRVGLVSDLEMTDSAPRNAASWLARLHRWVRGDWQNLRFLGRQFTLHGVRRPNPISTLARYQLFDNLRRSLNPVFAVLCVVLSCFTAPQISGILCAAAFLSIALGPLLGCVRALLGGWGAAASRRYFGHGLPLAIELAAQGGLLVSLCAEQAVASLDAAVRTLGRLRTGKHLLEWTTAAQSEVRRIGFLAMLRRSWGTAALGGLLVLFAPAGRWWIRLFGLFFLLYPALAAVTARKCPDRSPALSDEERRELLGWCAQMFRYYEDYANAENHYLPPDNVQFSPVERVARRTSPTNIGMLLLSNLAARDLHLIDSAGLALRLSRTFETIGQLETCHGNLYNWYATDDLRVLPDRFVSAVDSGNYLCALVTLKEGLYEYVPCEPRLQEIIDQIETILKTTDLSVFYNPNRELFSIGLDQNGNRVGSHYDFLMSEARTMSYYAIASRQVPHRHWRALNRSMSREGAYAGPISWTGTLFEYLMPHLLLPVCQGSLLGEAVHYALWCQKMRAKCAGLPWGISESGYFAFDSQLNYQYKAHGVQALAAKQGMDRECVVSPYSSFLALPFDPHSGMENLRRLEQLGLVGQYGFYEAADFTEERCGGEYRIVRSFMAHHVGMSLAAAVNALFQNRMQKRFLRDHAMGSAQEFLQEKVAKDVVVYGRMRKQEPTPREGSKREPLSLQPVGNPDQPVCGMLTGSGLSHFFADTGTNWLSCGDQEVTRRSRGLLRDSQGILAVVRLCGETISAVAAPFFQEGVEHRFGCAGGQAAYQARKGNLGISQTFVIDRSLPVEGCTVTVQNGTGIQAVADLLFYLEPVLSTESAYAAHPAFSKLFVCGGREQAADTVVFSRRNRDGSDGLFLTLGFDRRYSYAYALRREDVTPYPDGLQNLLRFDTLPFDGGTATPDGCCALRLSTLVPAEGEAQVTLLLSVAATLEESVGNLISVRERGVQPAQPVLPEDSLAGRMARTFLPALLFGTGISEPIRQARAESRRGQDALWSLGISGDRPILLYDWRARPEPDSLGACLRCWDQLRFAGLEFDLCLLGAPTFELPEGVRALDPDTLDPQSLTALYAASCGIFGVEGAAEGKRAVFPVEMLHLLPAEIPEGEDRFDLVGGAYLDGWFYVDRVTPLPFTHILANRTFGCLLNDASLGCTWWRNAHECRLSSWSNDIASGLDGERLLLQTTEGIYDLCKGARAAFSPEEARYMGRAGGIACTAAVALCGEQSAKQVSLRLENTRMVETEVVCTYLVEPVLGVSRLTAKHLQMEQDENCLLLHNPYTMSGCFAAIHVPGEHPSYTSSRAALLSGDWSARELIPGSDPVIGVMVRKRLPPHQAQQITFVLAAAASREDAIRAAKTACPGAGHPFERRTIRISTPSEPLDRLVNTFLPHQILAGRLFGRSAFYQSSGAYGFRDQLQDAGACLAIAPDETRRQILRCCTAQFVQGDVLHWWHPLPPGRMRGVRTRFSDDLLWLPYTVCDYLEATGDSTLLHHPVSFCAGEPLEESEQERYFETGYTKEKASVYGHCLRAIDRASRLGDRGIPLIGCGDWNDGFSNVGVEGRGQSVWLGMFLSILLERFAPVCEQQGDPVRAEGFRRDAEQLRKQIDRNCWDGRWYLRAFYDNGMPMGSRRNDECQIDLLPQSFAVLAEMPDCTRTDAALDSAIRRLVDGKHRLVRLFTPPFDRSEQQPGYVGAYPAGIRENGGQYTHAAVWFAMALLRAGRRQEGWDLLDLLNPSSRCTDGTLARQFKTEPYWMPADIYTHSGVCGHGGWSLYTGAAGWYYRAVLEELLGLRFRDGRLTLSPSLPPEWNRFSASIREGDAVLLVEVVRTGNRSLTVDGQPAEQIPADGGSHTILLTI